MERDERELETGERDPQGAINYWQMAANHANEEAAAAISALERERDYLAGQLADCEEANCARKEENAKLRECGKALLQMVDDVDDWTAEATAEIIEPFRAALVQSEGK
jgi:NAD(P)H-dependent flavin oxidoreductase YrpB (nitropropane dioxygenase family)